MTKISKDEGLELLAQNITECYASTQGCKRLPVRMLCELPTDGDCDAEIVMMCVEHAATYQPRGKVIFDQTINDESVALFAKHNL